MHCKGRTRVQIKLNLRRRLKYLPTSTPFLQWGKSNKVADKARSLFSFLHLSSYYRLLRPRGAFRCTNVSWITWTTVPPALYALTSVRRETLGIKKPIVTYFDQLMGCIVAINYASAVELLRKVVSAGIGDVFKRRAGVEGNRQWRCSNWSRLLKPDTRE